MASKLGKLGKLIKTGVILNFFVWAVLHKKKLQQAVFSGL